MDAPDPYRIPLDDDPATVLAALADAIAVRFDRIDPASIHPVLRDASVRVLAACRALPAGQPAPAGFVETIDGLADKFDGEVPWDRDVDFDIEIPIGCLVDSAAAWAHNRQHVDGDPLVKQFAAVRGAISTLDARLEGGS